MSLWTKNLIIGRSSSPQICKHTYLNTYNKGTSFITCQKASLTVEASIVVPIMIGFLVIILFFFRVIQVQSKVEEALIYAGREVAVESSMVSSEEILCLSAEVHMLEALKNSGIENYIEKGMLGISLWNSNFEGEEIVLRANYRMKLPVAFFEKKSIELFSENHFCKWIGKEGRKELSKWVYITKNGTVYHASISCRVLDLSVKGVEFVELDGLRGANGQKYYACDRCFDGDLTNGLVYCTDYGRLYHKQIDCSFLKRSVTKILMEEVGEREACSYCYN